MKNTLKNGLLRLGREKVYVICVGLALLLSYFFLWTHPSMGVDDTCVQRYFQDGFAPTQGRWTLFLLNRVFHVAEFTPFVVDFVGVMLMALGSTVLCVLFQSLSREKIPVPALTVFSCAMVSYPLIGEVFVYYLHNGIGLAYLLTALTVFMLFHVTSKWKYVYASMMMGVALSCYESFAMVYILCVALAYMVELYVSSGKESFCTYVKRMILLMIPLVAGMILRSTVANVICFILGREANMFSLSEAVKWIFSPDRMDYIKGMISLFGRYYVVNALANLGVAVYLGAVILFFVWICVCAIKKKCGMLFLNGLLVLVTPWLLSVMQGTAIPYRSMQTFPVFVGFAAMCLVWAAQKKGKYIYRIVLLGSVILIFNQAFQLNKTFYVDYLKYEEDLNTCRQMAYDIQREATLDKPVVFLGQIKEYGVVNTYAYLSEDTLRYQWISQIREMMGSDSENSYSTVQNFVWYNVFEWGVDSFEGNATELIKFFRWHGYDLIQATDEMYVKAQQQAADMTVWPKEGSILELDDCVIVKIGESK